MIDMISHGRFFYVTVFKWSTTLEQIHLVFLLQNYFLIFGIVQKYKVSLRALQSYISVKNLTLAQDPSSGKMQTLCPVRLGGYSLSLRAYWSSWRRTWLLTYHGDASVRAGASKLPSSCLVPSPYMTLLFNALTNSLSQLVLGTLGKVYLVSPSTHILARQEVQMNVTRAF